MKSGLTDITIILDRSGSMESIKTDMEGALKSFVQEQAKLPGECTLSVYQFDGDSKDWVVPRTPIGSVSRVPLQPRGCTPLYDAIGEAILKVGQDYTEMKEEDRPEKVLFVIITDGQENASRKFDRAKIYDMISDQRKTWKWEFLFLGANQDAYVEAGAIGIPLNAALTYAATSAGVKSMNSRLYSATMSYRSTGVASFVDPNSGGEPEEESKYTNVKAEHLSSTVSK